MLGFTHSAPVLCFKCSASMAEVECQTEAGTREQRLRCPTVACGFERPVDVFLAQLAASTAPDPMGAK